MRNLRDIGRNIETDSATLKTYQGPPREQEGQTSFCRIVVDGWFEQFMLGMRRISNTKQKETSEGKLRSEALPEWEARIYPSFSSMLSLSFCSVFVMMDDVKR